MYVFLYSYFTYALIIKHKRQITHSQTLVGLCVATESADNIVFWRYYGQLWFVLRLQCVCVWHGKSFRCFCPFFIFLNGFIYNIRMVEKNAKKKAHRIQTFGRRAHTHNAVRIGHLHLIRLNGIVTYDLQFQKWIYTQIHAWHFTLITLLLHVNAPLPFALSFSLISHLSS